MFVFAAAVVNTSAACRVIARGQHAAAARFCHACVPQTFSPPTVTLSSSPFPANDWMQHIFCAVVGGSHFTAAAVL